MHAIGIQACSATTIKEHTGHLTPHTPPHMHTYCFLYWLAAFCLIPQICTQRSIPQPQLSQQLVPFCSGSQPSGVIPA